MASAFLSGCELKAREAEKKSYGHTDAVFVVNQRVVFNQPIEFLVPMQPIPTPEGSSALPQWKPKLMIVEMVKLKKEKKRICICKMGAQFEQLYG